MSISQKIDSLKDHIYGERGLELLDELSYIMLRYSPEHSLKNLKEEMLLADDPDNERLLELLNELELATANYKRPTQEPNLIRGFGTDVKRWFGLARAYVGLGAYSELSDLVSRYYAIFSYPKKECGQIRTSCAASDCEGRFKNIEEVSCPECGTPRRLCKSSPLYSGRCRTHSSKQTALFGRLAIGRAKTYAQSLPGQLEESFIDVLTDPTYLSVAPEIAALAARSAQLMSQLGDVDYLAVQTKVRQSIARVRKAREDEDYWSVMDGLVDIEKQLTAVSDDKRRWDEIAALSGRLGRLADSERKRLIEEQKVITVSEMYALQNELLAKIKLAATVIALDVERKMIGGIDMDQKKIREMILRTIHGAVTGEVDIEAKLSRLTLEANKVIVEGELGSGSIEPGSEQAQG